MRTLFFIALIATCQNALCQNFFKWEVPTEEGNVTYSLLTQEGYENLLKPIVVGDLGGLTNELLLCKRGVNKALTSSEENKSELKSQSQIIEELINQVKDLEEKIGGKEIEPLNESETFLKFLESKIMRSYTEVTAAELSKLFNKTNQNKNGYSLIQICQILGIASEGKKSELCERIAETLRQ